MTAKKVLITGVYGLIAGAVYDHLCAQPEAYEVYGLARRRPSVRVSADWTLDIPEERFFQSDLSNLEEVEQAVQGMDAVVHMAAEPSPRAGWDRILASNIIGAYNLFEACRRANVKRVIAASSIMVSFGYRDVEPYKAITEGLYADVPTPVPMVTHEMSPLPRDLYASSKVFGENLARTYAYAHGLSCICLRIGWVVAEDRPPYREAQDVWCSQRDIVQLVERCITAPEDLRFDIFYGLSANRWRWVDIEHARQVVGYESQDHGEDFYPSSA
ncbi:MAG TPA: NAD(P)-dependent oxidoreductase [Chloroflexi bacterium]|nr:NAD(P)-dependent oxidoreductase [Chloroflexota bacterium]